MNVNIYSEYIENQYRNWTCYNKFEQATAQFIADHKTALYI